MFCQHFLKMQALQTLKFPYMLKNCGTLFVKNCRPFSSLIQKCNIGEQPNCRQRNLNTTPLIIQTFKCFPIIKGTVLDILAKQYGTESEGTSTRSTNCEPTPAQSTKSETNPDHGINKEGALDQKNEDDNLIPVYLINHLTKIRFLSLLKVYQTIFVVAFSPIFCRMWLLNEITTTAFLGTCGLMLFSTAMLYVIAQLFTSIACAIYFDSETERVKISHLTFRTRRKDVYIDLKEIVPASDVEGHRNDVYVPLMTYDNKYKFKVFLKMGTIYQEELLDEILGK